jgi:hypothetical protein
MSSPINQIGTIAGFGAAVGALYLCTPYIVEAASVAVTNLQLALSTIPSLLTMPSLLHVSAAASSTLITVVLVIIVATLHIAFSGNASKGFMQAGWVFPFIGFCCVVAGLAIGLPCVIIPLAGAAAANPLATVTIALATIFLACFILQRSAQSTTQTS